MPLHIPPEKSTQNQTRGRICENAYKQWFEKSKIGGDFHLFLCSWKKHKACCKKYKPYILKYKALILK